jgi:hypothetical protein
MTNKVVQPGYTLFQYMECKNFEVEGHKACSIITTRGNLAVLQVASFVDCKMYVFLLGGTHNDFGSHMPTFEKLLASFRAPP